MMDGWFGDLFAWIGAFFVFGSLWFVIAATTVFGCLIFLTERESNIFATIVLMTFIWIVTSVNGFSIVDNPVTTLKFAAAYLAIGVFWSFVKWFVFLFSKRAELKLYKEDFIERFAPPLTAEGKIAPEEMDDFIKFLNDQRYTPTRNPNNYRVKSQQDIIPSVASNVKDLTRWVAWWPFSVTWTLLNDALRKLTRTIVRACEGVYTKFANSVFSSEI